MWSGYAKVMCYVTLYYLTIGDCVGTLKEAVDVTIDTSEAIAVTSERYLSVAVDTNLMREGWHKFDVTSKHLQVLAQALSPCYLRLGGTMADFVIFDPSRQDRSVVFTYSQASRTKTYSGEYVAAKNKVYKNFTMTAKDWDDINHFALDTGCRLLFDINVLLRTSSGTWDPTNAILLLQYSVQHGYAANLDLELGNEPNAFEHNFNLTVSGSQLGKDFLHLRNLVRNTAQFKSAFKNSILVGPDVDGVYRKRSLHYLRKYLVVVQNAVDAVTWHQYYLKAVNATLKSFTDPNILDELLEEIYGVSNIVHSIIPNGKVWMGETSSASGGGAAQLSDTYVAGFMWLDKLGLCAQNGVDVVIRQTLYWGNYSLLAHKLQPLPDYWLSLLYKTFVGKQVLAVTSSDKSRNLRIYAHCTNDTRSGYPAGSITVYAMNLFGEAVNLQFVGSLAHSTYQEYLLTPHGSKGLQSGMVSLNGKKLKMVDDTTLPKFVPRHHEAGSQVTLPSKTFSFYVFTGAAAQACKQ